MGMGDKFDEAALKELPVGGFHAIPKRVHHYGMAKGQTIIQLHGVGPWGITYVNPSDDPSEKAAEKEPQQAFQKSRKCEGPAGSPARPRQPVQSHLRSGACAY